MASTTNKRQRLRLLASAGAVIMTGLWTVFFFGFLISSMIWPEFARDSWFTELMKKHPAGTVGIGITAIVAFVIVWVLDIFSKEPIKIELWVFKEPLINLG